MLPRAAECHSSNLPLSVKIVLAERWQQSPSGNGRSCWLRHRGERAQVLSASMIPGEMPQAISWIQENGAALCAKSDSDPQVSITLLHRHKRADRNFGKKFASSFFRQPNATV